MIVLCGPESKTAAALKEWAESVFVSALVRAEFVFVSALVRAVVCVRPWWTRNFSVKALKEWAVYVIGPGGPSIILL